MTPAQFRAARGFLGLSRIKIAKKLHVSPETIANMERGTYAPSKNTFEGAKAFFERNGISLFELPGGAFGVMYDPNRTRDALLMAEHEKKIKKNDSITVQDPSF